MHHGTFLLLSSDFCNCSIIYKYLRSFANIAKPNPITATQTSKSPSTTIGSIAAITTNVLSCKVSSFSCSITCRGLMILGTLINNHTAIPPSTASITLPTTLHQRTKKLRFLNKRKSDIDLLVEFDGPVGFFTFLDLEEYLEGILGLKVDLVSKKALKPRINKYILKELIQVWKEL